MATILLQLFILYLDIFVKILEFFNHIYKFILLVYKTNINLPRKYQNINQEIYALLMQKSLCNAFLSIVTYTNRMSMEMASSEQFITYVIFIFKDKLSHDLYWNEHDCCLLDYMSMRDHKNAVWEAVTSSTYLQDQPMPPVTAARGFIMLYVMPFFYGIA